jgi:ribonuclease P/MRP protein subunit POP5
LTSGEIASTLKKAVQKFYGDFGLASISNISVLLLNEKLRLAVIRTSHGPHKFLISILPILNKIQKELATYQILYNAPTILKCKKFIINQQNKKILSAFSEAEKKEFMAIS